MESRKIYLENYWLLFLEFIDAFEKLTYQNIPLALLGNFRHYLDESLREKMTKDDFKNHLKNKVIKDVEIQPKFESWLQPLRKSLSSKPVEGKILLNLRYLRFSKNNYTDYFDPNQTVVFTKGKQKEYQGIPIHAINNYSVEVIKEVKELTKKAKMIFKSIDNHPAFNDKYFYSKFINSIPLMIETIAAINRYLEENPISCIIVGSIEDLISRVLMIVAATKGIPSICMQHGLLCGDEAFMPVFSTKVAVYGQYEKNWYIQKGLSKDRIVITGHPRFDDIFTKKHMSNENFKKNCKIINNKKTLLCATQPFNASLWREALESLAQQSNLNILVKPHPCELSRTDKEGNKFINNYIFFEKRYKTVKVISDRKLDLYDILNNVDGVVVINSTVGVEACLLKKPIFILDNKSVDFYRRMEGFIYSNPTELAKFIIKFFKDAELQEIAEKKRIEFLDYAYPQKLSGHRLIEEINKLTGRKYQIQNKL